MEKILKLIASISGALLLLFLVEGLMTFGQAFNFDKYNTFSWIVQAFLIIFVSSFSAMLSLYKKK